MAPGCEDGLELLQEGALRNQDPASHAGVCNLDGNLDEWSVSCLFCISERKEENEIGLVHSKFQAYFFRYCSAGAPGPAVF